MYLKGLLTDLPLTTYPGRTLNTFVAPPVPGDMSVPTCYIWGAQFNESRQTAPRGSAFKTVTYDVDIWVFVVDDPNSQGVDQRFPVLIDEVQDVLRKTEMPVTIQDPTTQATSQILSVGETFEVRYDVERTIADERYVRMLALITASIVEVTQG